VLGGSLRSGHNCGNGSDGCYAQPSDVDSAGARCTLALAALMLTWSWVLGLIELFGGFLASHVKVMVIEGRSAQEAERRHVAQKATA
jgi:hypothetical protein